MRKIWTFVIFSISLLIGLLVYRFYTCPCNIDRNSFRDVYQSSVANQDIYEIQSSQEISSNLRFPLGNVEKAIVTKGIFSLDHTIDKTLIPKILDLLNDTSNYVWGEVGTFWLGKRIIFYSGDDTAIGITDIDVSGTFTYSYPYLSRMKWGTLTATAADELNALIVR